jgi:hypothetical protein
MNLEFFEFRNLELWISGAAPKSAASYAERGRLCLPL